MRRYPRHTEVPDEYMVVHSVWDAVTHYYQPVYELSTGRAYKWSIDKSGWLEIWPCARCRAPGHAASVHKACVFCGSPEHLWSLGGCV